MASNEVLDGNVPAEEQVIMIHEDWKAKLISNSFAKMLCVLRFNEDPELNPNPESSLEEAAANKFRHKCHIFCEMLKTLSDLPYHQFWSTVIYNVPAMETIFDYLNLVNNSPQYNQLLTDDDLIRIRTFLYTFFYRLFCLRENGDRSLSQKYHDDMLIKYFNSFKYFGNFLLYVQNLNTDFAILITGFINRNEQWFGQQLEIFRDNVNKKIKEFQAQPNMRREFLEIVKELWLIRKYYSFVHSNPNLNMIMLQEEFIDTLVSFYCFFLTIYKNYIQTIKPRNTSDLDESSVEIFQVTIVSLFLSCFDKVFLDDIRKSLTMSNNELYRSLETFDFKMKVLFTDYPQFAVDFFHYFSFEQVFPLFYGDQLKKIIKPETSLLNYRTALDEAEEAYQFSNLWWSKKDFEVCSKTDTERETEKYPVNVQEREEKMVVEESPKVSPKKYEFLNLSKNTFAAFEMIKDFLGSDQGFGDGYLYLCLEYFGFDNEKTINAILEDALPGTLKKFTKDLTLDEVNDILNLEAAQPNKQIAQMYIGKKDKVNSVLKQDKSVLKERTLGLTDKIAQEEEEKVAEMQRLVERGADLEVLRNNQEFFGLAIYNDECDDTYENEDVSIEKSLTIEQDDRENFDRRNKLNHSDDNSSQNLQNVNRQNSNYTLPNRNQWKDEQEAEDDTEAGDGQGRRSNFIPNEKFSNAAQYRKNQFRNKKNFNQRNANSNAGDNSQQQQQHGNRNNNQQQNKGQNNNNNNNSNDNQNQGSRKGNQNNRGRGNPNSRGNFRGNMNNTKRPNHETGNGINPNKRK